MTTKEAELSDLAQLREDLGKVREDLKDVADGVVRKGRDGVKVLQKQAGDSLASAKEFVEERPMTMVAVAFGAGLLAGLLLRRR